MTAINALQMRPDAHATPLPDPGKFESGYRAVRDNPSIQFDFPVYAQKPPVTPEWMKAIGRWLKWLGEWVSPALPYLFWALVALLLLALIVALVPPLRRGAVDLWRKWRGRAAQEKEVDEPQWQPEANVARALLKEADELARAGRYDEAVHLILFRSIEDIEAWRGDIVRPSLTSRDIARAKALPGTARQLFSRIVASVERSLFGGQPLGKPDWDAARADYAQFALKGAA